jgi:hypothetical protein
MMGFQIPKPKQGAKPAKNASVSMEIRRFKSIAEFARKAAFVSLLSLYPCAAPMAANAALAYHPDRKSIAVHNAAKMTDGEKASLAKLGGALALFSFAFAGALVYSNTGKRKETAKRERQRRNRAKYGDR